MDDPLILEALDRLDSARLPGAVENLVLGALLGRMTEVVDGVRIARPVAAARGEEPTPVRAYLESVVVTGFRGVGPTCELHLQPGPGLTLVVGRNGSGKSSFAEAAEFALTGDSLRWSNKSQEWKTGWRNLHADVDPEIKVTMRVEGEREPRVVRVRWGSGKLESAKSEVTIPGEGRHSLDSLGWGTPVKSFRPFLSYTELTAITGGKPVDRYNALAPMLGMESLRGPLEDLRQARLAAQKQIEAAHDAVDAVREMPALAECSDGKPAEAAEALRGRWDLDRIEALVAGADPAAKEREQLLAALEHIARPDVDRVDAAASDLRAAAEALDALSGSRAEQARKLAGMLEAAVEIHDRHGDSDCPVCGQEAGLHEARVMELRNEIERLRSEARAIDDALKADSDARTAAKDAMGVRPEVLATAGVDDLGVDTSDLQAAWDAWLDAPESGAELAAHLESAYLPLAEATDSVRLAAGTYRQQLADQWRPIAERLTRMLPDARAGQQAEQRLPALKRAEAWLKRCEATIRDARFDAVKSQVTRVWETLSIGSNVTLEDVRLGARKVSMDVTVDGAGAGALGVMSQGELNALALSLFVPRVTFDDSPFRFAMVDDPVQAMDPVRVDGLARVLHDLARTHQVVVFTHDDRLASAIRRLQLPATILSVTRRPRSQVELKKSLDPVRGAIEDARAVELSDGLPDEVRRRVVPGLCRQAIEAACLESGRRRLLAGGMSLDECEETWATADRLLPRVAIGLYGDPERAGDVYGTLNNRFGPWEADTVRDCNRMTHSGAGKGTDLKALISCSESLAANLAAP
ncbi:MAG: AAA family ATPase [bacterium]|nr:AAA family ATPase [bacterium]